MIKKIIYSIILAILFGSALYAICTKKIILPYINLQSVLAFIGILAVLFALIKIFSPEIKLEITSMYYTFDENKRGLFILKLQTISNVDLVLEEVNIAVTQENDKAIKMVPFSPIWKAIIFKMLDIKREEKDYKLLKPLEPRLRICGIKQGSNECYISIKSAEIFEDKPIKSWSFDLKYRQHLLPIPKLPWFNRKIITVIQPDPKDRYFDDSLFKKISPEERKKIIDEL